jgi:hypothetical protein
MLVSDTLKNFRFFTEVLLVHWTFSRDESNLFYFPVFTVYHHTYDTPEGHVLVLHCAFRSSEVPITDIWHPLVFQNAKDVSLISHGWEDRYSVWSQPPKSLLWYCLLWLTLLDSSVFRLCKGTLHFPISCSVPYSIMCEVKVLKVLDLGWYIIP